TGPRTLERRRVVALLAVDPEATGMDIFARMTGAADHRWLDDVLRPDMTVGATDLGVRAQQREARVSRVIEVPHLPTVGCVALGAVLAKSSIVNIVLRMAAQTFLRRVIESLARMTLAAAHDHMQSGQGVLGLIVVEIDFLPAGRVVALLALLAERAAM